MSDASADASRAPGAAPGTVSALPRGVLAFCGALLAVGIISRVVPLLDIGGRMLAQWPTEDGYFMLAMARNVALGHGLSVTGGEMPTNGTQPGTTFVWSVLFWLVGGDRNKGVLLVQILEVFIALGTSAGLYRLGLKVLIGHPARETVSALTAALWFASPLVVPHTMNCLETGAYACIGVWITSVFIERPLDDAVPWTWGRSVAVGVLLGAAFWARNDACFLILGACLVYLYSGYHCGPVVVRERFLRTLVFGATSVLTASPWLIHNYTNFGHIMPVSGRAESLTGKFATNLDDLPSVLVEYLLVLLPIPQKLQDHPVVVAGCVLGLLVTVAILLVAWRNSRRPVRALIVMIGIYAVALSLFYGLFFGAPWFIARYTMPLSPYFTLLTVTVAWKLWSRLGMPVQMPMAATVGLGALLLAGGLNVRLYTKGSQHPHFQVVDWVKQNTSEATYVGAVQTGTLGFFHDKTINLDGKVNIAAYEALTRAELAEYVAASNIEVLADWAGLADWYEMPLIQEHFDLIVHDTEKNLSVLRRKRPGQINLGKPTPPPTPVAPEAAVVAGEASAADAGVAADDGGAP
jgi:hypothetical protein